MTCHLNTPPLSLRLFLCNQCHNSVGLHKHTVCDNYWHTKSWVEIIYKEILGLYPSSWYHLLWYWVSPQFHIRLWLFFTSKVQMIVSWDVLILWAVLCNIGNAILDTVIYSIILCSTGSYILTSHLIKCYLSKIMWSPHVCVCSLLLWTSGEGCGSPDEQTGRQERCPWWDAHTWLVANEALQCFRSLVASCLLSIRYLQNYSQY